MKTRTDFVSNSSSSSFMFSIDNNYSLKELVHNISKNCECDFWDNEKLMNIVLNNSELSYFGRMWMSNFTSFINRGDREFDYYEKLLKNGNDWWVNQHFKFIDSDTIQFSDSVYDEPYVFSIDTMTRIHDIEDDQEFLKEIVNQKNSWEYRSYRVTTRTVENTERLIRLGKTIHPYNDIQTLESIKERLKNGESIYNIHVTTSGDGCDEDAFRQESKEFILKNIKCELLYSENY